jgi:hypothetical protein
VACAATLFVASTALSSSLFDIFKVIQHAI